MQLRSCCFTAMPWLPCTPLEHASSKFHSISKEFPVVDSNHGAFVQVRNLSLHLISNKYNIFRTTLQVSLVKLVCSCEVEVCVATMKLKLGFRERIINIHCCWPCGVIGININTLHTSNAIKPADITAPGRIFCLVTGGGLLGSIWR